jgi:hypothetical protein
MINSNAPYSGLANIMNMRDRNPNTQLAYVPNGYLNSVPTAPNPYTGIPQVNSPIAMNEGGMPSMQYPMQEEAGQLADRGRYGDTTLVHMTPGEVQGLASLGQLTINPDTGLPEAFNMKALIPMIAAVAGSIFFPPAAAALGATSLGTGYMGAAIGAGLGSFGGSLATGAEVGDAALSGLMSFGTGAILGGAGGASAFADATGAALPSGATAGVVGAGTPATVAPSVGNVTGSLNQTLIPNSTINGMQTLIPNSTINGMQTLIPSGGVPSVGLTPIAPSVATAGTTDVFNLTKVVPGTKGVWGIGATDALPIGQAPRSEILARGFQPADITIAERAGQTFSKPSTYVPAALGAVTGAFNDPYEYEYEEPEARPTADSGFGDYTLAGGEVKRPVASQAELRRRALEGGSSNYFNPYTYVRNVAEGGIVGLQQGGMATPQAPSAMSAMLAQPMQQQQPVPINIAVQPMQQPMQQQQPMPMPGMGQPQPQGIQPLPDQSIAFKKNMDMEEQLQKQKTASSLKGQSSLLGLIGGAGNYLQSQGIGYPTTTPSGSIPQTPAVNQGAQVNMGASGGFAQGGLLGYNAGGLLGYNEGGMPSQEQGYFEGQVVGNGDGQSDCVPFKVDSEEIDMAMLSPDEYVLAADVVSYIGDGSSNAGAAKLDQFMVDVRKQAHGSGKQIEGFQERGLANLVA